MLRSARKKSIHIGPRDNGRRMSLDDFDEAIGQEGYLYELGKGIIEVSNVPRIDHGRQVQELRDQLVGYKLATRGVIDYLASGNEAKLLIGSSESERHPDLSVYLNPAPEVDDVWSIWVPEIVIEVVSNRSARRDYQDKPQEYLEFGVNEYWIIDATKPHMKVHIRWRGKWQERIVKASQKYTTRLLPGFTLDLKKVLAAAAPGK